LWLPDEYVRMRARFYPNCARHCTHRQKKWQKNGKKNHILPKGGPPGVAGHPAAADRARRGRAILRQKWRNISARAEFRA